MAMALIGHFYFVDEKEIKVSYLEGFKKLWGDL